MIRKEQEDKEATSEQASSYTAIESRGNRRKVTRKSGNGEEANSTVWFRSAFRQKTRVTAKNSSDGLDSLSRMRSKKTSRNNSYNSPTGSCKSSESLLKLDSGLDMADDRESLFSDGFVKAVGSLENTQRNGNTAKRMSYQLLEFHQLSVKNSPRNSN